MNAKLLPMNEYFTIKSIDFIQHEYFLFNWRSCSQRLLSTAFSQSILHDCIKHSKLLSDQCVLGFANRQSTNAGSDINSRKRAAQNPSVVVWSKQVSQWRSFWWIYCFIHVVVDDTWSVVVGERKRWFIWWWKSAFRVAASWQSWGGLVLACA